MLIINYIQVYLTKFGLIVDSFKFLPNVNKYIHPPFLKQSYFLWKISFKKINQDEIFMAVI